MTFSTINDLLAWRFFYLITQLDRYRRNMLRGCSSTIRRHLWTHLYLCQIPTHMHSCACMSYSICECLDVCHLMSWWLWPLNVWCDQWCEKRISSLEVKRVCFDILRRERHRQGGLLDVCPVNSFAQGNILPDCVRLPSYKAPVCLCGLPMYDGLEPKLLVFAS